MTHVYISALFPRALQTTLIAALCLGPACASNESPAPSGPQTSATGGAGGSAGGGGSTGGGTGGTTSSSTAGSGGQTTGTGGTGGTTPTDTAGPGPADVPAAPSDAREASAPDSPTSPADTGAPGPGNKLPVAPSAGCTAAEQLPEGMGTLPSGRRYAVHLPTGYDKTKPFPLVFGLHPNGGNIGMFADTKTRTVMKEWTILVLTQSETGDWRQAFPADLGYFDALVPLLKEKLCVDTNRIYSFGFSGGGSFSNLLACKRDFLRAVGSGGGIPGYNGYTAADCKPMPSWVDEGERAGLVELWRAKNGCTQEMPGNRANCRTYACTAAPVVYCTNGVHNWPSYGSEDVSAFFKQF